MVSNITTKLLCLLLITTTFVLAAKDECEELRSYFDSKEDKIITVEYCEVEDEKLTRLSVIRDWDYELPEEYLLKIFSYENLVVLSTESFEITQTLINKLSELSNLEEFSATYSSFEDPALDYSPL